MRRLGTASRTPRALATIAAIVVVAELAASRSAPANHGGAHSLPLLERKEAATGFGPGGSKGAGAEIRTNFPGEVSGQVAFQLVRTSTPVDIARATARENELGLDDNWALVSYAVCAKPLGGIRAEHEIKPGGFANVASSACDPGMFVHGAGGGGGTVDGGPVWLRWAYPRRDLKSVSVALTAPFPDGQVVASATCAR
jgi:hypothetical protein